MTNEEFARLHPSVLIRVALTDLRQVEADPRYHVDHGLWHCPVKEVFDPVRAARLSRGAGRGHVHRVHGGRGDGVLAGRGAGPEGAAGGLPQGGPGAADGDRQLPQRGLRPGPGADGDGPQGPREPGGAGRVLRAHPELRVRPGGVGADHGGDGPTTSRRWGCRPKGCGGEAGDEARRGGRTHGGRRVRPRAADMGAGRGRPAPGARKGAGAACAGDGADPRPAGGVERAADAGLGAREGGARRTAPRPAAGRRPTWSGWWRRGAIGSGSSPRSGRAISTPSWPRGSRWRGREARAKRPRRGTAAWTAKAC